MGKVADPNHLLVVLFRFLKKSVKLSNNNILSLCSDCNFFFFLLCVFLVDSSPIFHLFRLQFFFFFFSVC